MCVCVCVVELRTTHNEFGAHQTLWYSSNFISSYITLHYVYEVKYISPQDLVRHLKTKVRGEDKSTI